jgi:hypothetical protein
MSLLGFLFDWRSTQAPRRYPPRSPASVPVPFDPTDLVIVMSAALGGLMMLGLAATLPRVAPDAPEDDTLPASADRRRAMALWGLNGAVMFVLAGFELGIVLQGQQHPTLSSREISLMFAECSLVMLGVNALLFFTGLLERAAGRGVMAAGLVLAIAGLAMLAQHRSGLDAVGVVSPPRTGSCCRRFPTSPRELPGDGSAPRWAGWLRQQVSARRWARRPPAGSSARWPSSASRGSRCRCWPRWAA